MLPSASSMPYSFLRSRRTVLTRRADRARCRAPACARRAAPRRAARRRRFDLGGLRAAAGHRLGRPPRRAHRRPSTFPIASSTRASPATRPPAAARGCRRCSPSTSRRSSSIELGGNDGLRGGSLEGGDATISTRWSSAVQKAGAKALLVGMKLPPNYGPAYAREFDAMFGDVAKAHRAPLVPFLFEGFGERNELFQPDRIHPTAAAQPQTARQRLAGARRRCSGSRGDRCRRTCATARTITVDAPRGIPGAHRRAQPVRVRRGSPSRRRRTIRCWTTPSARASARCTRRSRAFAARRAGAALVARNIATMLEGPVRDEAARLGAARLLLARRPAQPLARAHAERDRLARRAARRRLSRVSAARDRAARDAAVAASASTSSAGSRARARADSSTRSRPRARRCSTSKRSRGIAARCWAIFPASPQPVAEGIREPARRRARCARPARAPSTSSRRASGSARCSFPTRCSTAMRDAPCIRLDTPHALRIALLKDEYAHFRRRSPTRSPRGSRVSCRCTARKTIERWEAAAAAGDWDALVGELLAQHYDPDVRALDRAQLSARPDALVVAPASLDRRGVPRPRARPRRAVRARDASRLARDCLRRHPMPTFHFRIVNVFAEDAARRQSAVRVRGRARPRRRDDAGTRAAVQPVGDDVRAAFDGATARVRIFTPTFEMPFAGHPTLGTAHVVRDLAAGGDASRSR